MLDTLEAQYRFLPEVAKEAEEKKFKSLVHNSQELQKLCSLAGDLLGLYTREEQLFLINLRNQFVHSYFANRHRDIVNVKYALEGKIVVEHIPRSEYHAIIRLFMTKDTIDNTLQPLISRALNPALRYWTAMGDLQTRKEDLYNCLHSGKTIEIRV